MLSPVYRSLFSLIPSPSRKVLPFVQILQHSSASFKNMTSPAKWKIEKTRILNMPLDEKIKLYASPDYVTLESVSPWDDCIRTQKGLESKKHNLEDLEVFQRAKIDNEKNTELIRKVSIFKGDITKLEVDAIVNAANSLLKAGGGVDGAIHRAAGPLLQQECNTLGGCPTGQAKVTGGYNLPAKYVIHTVGPQNGSAPDLQSCYEKCLSYVKEYDIKSIAFPCISTGIYGFPNRLAAHIALKTARKFLEENLNMNRIIFCTFLPIDVDIYETLMQMYFPMYERRYNDGASVTE
ncbi:macro domain-containing protein RSc0334-like [Cydia fagiglandana]|uniref:macro domain-containing protein RSc0334-like n=1 Tax=Cydia fagiglandana TaxID=1458189 RepID=UPI002FEE372E